MASAPKKKPLPEGFEQWSAEEKVAYIEQLWEIVHQQHAPEELPPVQWQVEAVEASWRQVQEHPETALSAEGAIAELRAMVAQKKTG